MYGHQCKLSFDSNLFFLDKFYFSYCSSTDSCEANDIQIIVTESRPIYL